VTAVTRHLVGTTSAREGVVARDRPSDRLRRENSLALAIMADHEAAGRGRHGAVSAAKRLALDPYDPAELEKLQQRFRRLRRDAQKNERCSVADMGSE
jgi:hypothetical protein